jgi:tRNA-Thr(GGU) m(6)t(6)A37 methyltransferase TsaA
MNPDEPLSGEGTPSPGQSAALRLEPIGLVHSPFTSQVGVPVQPACAGPEDVGTIEIYERFAAGLTDLDGFERIWVVSWLHRAGPARLRVIPYRDRRERGLFATRAPSRPNPIGISAVRLLRREGRILHVADLDLLDGTPVLDLKPYAPTFDAFPASREGWLASRREEVGRADGRFADEP